MADAVILSYRISHLYLSTVYIIFIAIVTIPSSSNTNPTILFNLRISHLLANFADTNAPKRQNAMTNSMGPGKISAPMEI